MKCPHCQVTMSISYRENVEIDYCPDCRGVWLDRGELDKLIERVSEIDRGRGRGYDGERESGHKDEGRRERGGFLGDLFDFGG